MKPCPIELIGCGALAELVYAPVLAHLEKSGRVQVMALVDPAAERRARLAKLLPSARAVANLEELPDTAGALAVIASPPGFHAAQARALLGRGRHVLCEKPLAMSVDEAETMVAAAKEARRMLAAGMMRRFYPAAQLLRENLLAGTFGEPLKVNVIEGGRFGWQAASPKFFEPTNGGVLYDLGSHAVDLVCHWFGAPEQTSAWLDALGGTNTNAVCEGRWPGGLTVRVRLSWDTAALPAGWHIQTNRGECHWDGSPGGALRFRPHDGEWDMRALAQKDGQEINSSWIGCFVRQFENVLGAVAGKNPLLAPAEDVLPSLRWLEQARNEAKPMPQPWLSPAEQSGATQLALK